jgi:hypothetical protein
MQLKYRQNFIYSFHKCSFPFTLTNDTNNTRVIQKVVPFANIASAALRSRWCARVPSLLILWQGADGICRHSNSVYAPCCLFIMFNKIENPAGCEVRSAIRFLNAKNMILPEIHRQPCDVYGKHAVSSSVVRRWLRLFHEGRENVHDNPRKGRPWVVNEDLVRAVEEKIRENRWFTITPLSLHFPQISRSLLHKIVFEVKEAVPSQAASLYAEGIQNWRNAMTSASTMVETMSKSSVRCVHQMAIYMVCNIFLYFS